MSTRLSEHLALAEVTHSDTAKRLGIPNVPTPEHVANLALLAEAIFEPLRAHFGVALFVSSGYRSEALNAATPGSAKFSQHALGQALDLDQDGRGNGVTNAAVFEYIRTALPFDQLIWEFGDDDNPDWVHVSYRPQKRRQEVLRAHRVNGVAKYEPWQP